VKAALTLQSIRQLISPVKTITRHSSRGVPRWLAGFPGSSQPGSLLPTRSSLTAAVLALSLLVSLLVTPALVTPALAADSPPASPPPAPEQTTVQDQDSDSKATPEYGQFSEDILTRTITAEMAAQRGHYQQALDIYVELALETDNLSIIQRTMRIASTLRNIPITIDMSERWLAKEPGSIEARQSLALQLIASARYREATKLLGSLLDDGHPVDFRLVSSTVARDPNASLFIDTLIADFVNLLDRFPDDQSLQLSLAHLYQQNDQTKDALFLVQDLAKAMDDAPEVVMLEVELLERLGESSRAQRRLTQSLKSNPESLDLRLRYARKLLDQKKYNEAKEQFSLIVELDPHDYDTLYSLALLSLEENLLSDARHYLQQLVINGQRLDDAHYYLGYIDGQENQPTRAIEHYFQVKGGSNFMQAQRNLTELMIRSGRYAEVKTHLQNIRFRNADLNIPLLSMEANVLMDEGEEDLAATVLNSAIGAFPTNMQLLFLRSVLSQNRNDLILMEQDLRKIIQLNPTNPIAYNSLGYTLADRTERYQEAYDLILKAVELAPNDPAIIDSLGWVQYRLGKLDEARDNLERAFELFPDAEVAAHLGEVLWVMGDKSAAQRVWRKALDNQPDSAPLRATIQRLSPGTDI